MSKKGGHGGHRPPYWPDVAVRPRRTNWGRSLRSLHRLRIGILLIGQAACSDRFAAPGGRRPPAPAPRQPAVASPRPGARQAGGAAAPLYQVVARGPWPAPGHPCPGTAPHRLARPAEHGRATRARRPRGRLKGSAAFAQRPAGRKAAAACGGGLRPALPPAGRGCGALSRVGASGGAAPRMMVGAAWPLACSRPRSSAPAGRARGFPGSTPPRTPAQPGRTAGAAGRLLIELARAHTDAHRLRRWAFYGGVRARANRPGQCSSPGRPVQQTRKHSMWTPTCISGGRSPQTPTRCRTHKPGPMQGAGLSLS